MYTWLEPRPLKAEPSPLTNNNDEIFTHTSRAAKTYIFLARSGFVLASDTSAVT